MPANAPILDPGSVDFERVLVGRDGIREWVPQRFEFEMLDAILHYDGDAQIAVARKRIGPDEFWVRGHIPGRPLLPGVLMIECAAQVASFYTREYVGWKGFIGFGGVEDCKFRMQVPPGKRMYVMLQKIWERHRRILCKAQGVVDGQLAFEASIVGSEF